MIDIVARHTALMHSGLSARDASLAMARTELRELINAADTKQTATEVEAMIDDALARFPMPGGT